MQQLFLKAFSWYSININKILFFTFCTVLAILFAERFFIIFSYEGHTAGIDNNFDYPIIRSLAGYSLYPNPSDYPFAVNPYAPLFFIVCKYVALLFHISATDTISVYRVSRLISLLADAGTCSFLFIIITRFVKASQVVAISSISLFFSILCFLGYTINRSDSLFLFFYIGTLFSVLRKPFTKSMLQPFISAVLATLCVYSKQNGIVLLILIPIWFALEKDYRSALQFFFFTVLFCSAIFVYFELYYADHFFSEHIINSLKNRIDPRWFYVYVFKLIAGSYLTLPLAAALVISAKSISGTGRLLKKLGFIFIFQFLFSTALGFKWGSSQGYYNECFLLSAIIIAAFLNSIASSKRQEFITTVSTYVYPAFLLFALHITAQLYFFFLNGRSEAREKFTEQMLVSNYIKKSIGAESRYVMNLSNPDFDFFKNILYKESAAPNMDAVSCCTLPDNIFNYTDLTDGLKNGKIAFLIEDKTDQKKTQWGIDLQHYKRDTSFATYSIYKYDSLPKLLQ